MRPPLYLCSADSIRRFLLDNRVATLPQLKQFWGSDADMAVFRKLKELSYRTSYSHRGSFYTLDEIAVFDERGLWSCGPVRFSAHGTLIATTEVLVTRSSAGHFASELEELLSVPVKEPLLHLVSQHRITRETIDGLYLYCSNNAQAQQRQLRARKERTESAPATPGDTPSSELHAAIILFASVLDERQRPCSAVWNRSSWVATAISPASFTWTRTPCPRDAANSWHRTSRLIGYGPWANARRWKKTPEVIEAIQKLMEKETAGDPMSGLKGTRKTTSKIARELRRFRITVSRHTVGRLLRQMDFCLRTNRKTVSCGSTSDRDRQFRYLHRRRDRFEKCGDPVLSADAKVLQTQRMFSRLLGASDGGSAGCLRSCASLFSRAPSHDCTRNSRCAFTFLLQSLRLS